MSNFKLLGFQSYFNQFWCATLTIVCLIFGTQSGYAQTPAVKETFPRIGGINIVPRFYENPVYQANLAKADWIIFGFFEGWNANGLSSTDVIANIKSMNPNLIAANYANPSAVRDEAPTMAKKLSSERGPNGIGDWWGYDASGNRLRWMSAAYHVNYTSFVTPDANGDRWPQWRAKFDKATFFDKADFDMVFIDNFSSGDWTGTGKPDYDRNRVADDSETRDARYRAAHGEYVDQFRALLPNHAVVGNVSDWMNPGVTDNVYPEYRDKLDGGILERVIGSSFALEGSNADGSLNTWGTWQKMMDGYLNAVKWTSGKFIMFNVSGYKNDYQTMRYGLASCLMGDGYYNYTDIDELYSSLPWYDEYDVQLGRSLSPRQTSPWQSGVYRRDFEYGIVLVNPRGNGKKTVRLEPGFTRFSGKQDPDHNNGQRVETLTLNDRDGIILLREGAVSRPQPPTLFSD